MYLPPPPHGTATATAPPPARVTPPGGGRWPGLLMAALPASVSPYAEPPSYCRAVSLRGVGCEARCRQGGAEAGVPPAGAALAPGYGRASRPPRTQPDRRPEKRARPASPSLRPVGSHRSGGRYLQGEKHLSFPRKLGEALPAPGRRLQSVFHRWCQRYTGWAAPLRPVSVVGVCGERGREAALRQRVVVCNSALGSTHGLVFLSRVSEAVAAGAVITL